MIIDRLEVARHGRFLFRWKACCYVDGVYTVDFGFTRRGVLSSLFILIAARTAREMFTPKRAYRMEQ
jgi:hypothetical protein